MQTHFAGFNLKDKVVITAGAYTGDTPLYYAYYGAKVYAFEPDPKSFKVAIKNIGLNPALKKNIILENCAINHDGQVNFPLSEDSSGSSIYKLKENKSTVVRSVSISFILEKYKITSPYLLDLDIKGSEFVVINDNGISKFEGIRMELLPLSCLRQRTAL
ncbi:MAG: FkbM family methyltransferase [Thermoplasmatales archaeon]